MSSLKVSYNITTAQNSIRIHNQEGYVTKLRRSGSLYAGLRLDPVYTTYYYRRDHLGNNVAVWNATKDSTEQRMFYYASGLPMSCSTSQSLQSRKYNGKEYVEDHGYDVYDYGFRGYYATIGRFTITNPLAEQTPWQSPYAYASNNSINNVDLWGLGAITISSSFQTSHINVQTCNWAAVDSNGNVLGWGDDEDDFHVYLVNELWDGTYVGLNGFRKIGWEIRTNDFSGYEIGSPCYYLRSVTHGDWKNGAFVAVGSMQLMYGNQVIAPSKMIDNTLDAALHYYIGFGRPAALGNHETYMAFWKKLLPHDNLILLEVFSLI